MVCSGGHDEEEMEKRDWIFLVNQRLVGLLFVRQPITG